MVYKKVLLAWLMGGILILPWVWWPSADVAFEVPRVNMFIGWTLVLAGLSLWRWKQAINFKIFLLLMVWILVIIVSSIPTWRDSWAGNYYRADGITTQVMLTVFAICVAWSKISGRRLLVIQVISSALVSLLVVSSWLWPRLQMYLPKSFWWLDGAVGLTFGNPHLLAGFILVSLAGGVGLKIMMPRKYGLAMTLILMLHMLAIAATEAYLVMGLSGVILTWGWWFEAKKRWIPIILTGLAMVIFLGWVFRPVNTFEAESRSRMWHRAIIAWSQKPILGWGWAEFPIAIEKVSWPYPVSMDIYIDKAHSSLVETLTTTGILGFGIYIGLWGLTLKKIENRGWKLVVMAYLIMSQLNVISISTEILGFMGVGLALANEEY